MNLLKYDFTMILEHFKKSKYKHVLICNNFKNLTLKSLYHGPSSSIELSILNSICFSFYYCSFMFSAPTICQTFY